MVQRAVGSGILQYSHCRGHRPMELGSWALALCVRVCMCLQSWGFQCCTVPLSSGSMGAWAPAPLPLHLRNCTLLSQISESICMANATRTSPYKSQTSTLAARYSSKSCCKTIPPSDLCTFLSKRSLDPCHTQEAHTGGHKWPTRSTQGTQRAHKGQRGAPGCTQGGLGLPFAVDHYHLVLLAVLDILTKGAAGGCCSLGLLPQESCCRGPVAAGGRCCLGSGAAAAALPWDAQGLCRTWDLPRTSPWPHRIPTNFQPLEIYPRKTRHVLLDQNWGVKLL